MTTVDTQNNAAMAYQKLNDAPIENLVSADGCQHVENKKAAGPVDDIEILKSEYQPGADFGVMLVKNVEEIVKGWCEALEANPQAILGDPVNTANDIAQDGNVLRMAGRPVIDGVGQAGVVAESTRRVRDNTLLQGAVNELTKNCTDIGIRLELGDDEKGRLLEWIAETDGSLQAVHAVMVEKVEQPLVDLITSQALEAGDMASFGLDAYEDFKIMTMLWDSSLRPEVPPGHRLGQTMAESTALAEKIRLIPPPD